jgi:hypothetical protein
VTSISVVDVGDDRGFRRIAGVAAVASVPFAAANLTFMFAAVHFDLNAMSHPVVLLRQGPTAATLWRWSMVFDTLGYYLLIVPALLALRGALRRRSPTWIDFGTLNLLAYCLIGAIGGAILATAIPPLIDGYAHAAAQRDVLETVFNSYSDAVYRGLWNLLEEFLAGLGWLAFGLVAAAERRRFGRVTIVLGLACLVDSLGTALNVDLVASVGLTIYFVLAPAGAAWVGADLLRDCATDRPT